MNREFKSENLTVSGPMTEAVEVVTLKAGEKVVRGELLAKDGAEYKSWTKGDDASRIASEDADAADGDINISVFKGGNFNVNGLTVPDDTTVADYSDELWLNNIHVETNISRGA